MTGDEFCIRWLYEWKIFFQIFDVSLYLNLENVGSRRTNPEALPSWGPSYLPETSVPKRPSRCPVLWPLD